MLLAGWILMLLVTGLVGVGIEFANMMSDAPTERMSHGPTLACLGMTAALFTAWWFLGGKPITW